MTFSKKQILSVAFTIAASHMAVFTPQAHADPDDACERMAASQQPLVTALRSELGAWESCLQSEYTETEWSTESTLNITWQSVDLTIQYRSPETGIYIVEAQDIAALSSSWYETNKSALVQSGFKMNWDYDAFPGPTSEHYASKNEGTNAQIWVERDKDGNVTWLRFSYAL